MASLVTLYVTILSCGLSVVLAFTQQKFIVNGQQVDAETFQRLKNGDSFGGMGKGNNFGNSKFGSSNFGNSPFGMSSSTGSSPFASSGFGSKSPSSSFGSSPPSKPLQRKPSLIGSSSFGFPGQAPSVSYMLNGKPVSQQEFEAAKAKRPSEMPGGGSKPSQGGGKQQGGGKTPAGAAPMSAKSKKAVVEAHNKYREQVATGKVPGQPKATQMTKLTWDDELGKIAAKWAARCEFKHANTEDYCGISGLPSVGENLGTGTMRSNEEIMTEDEITEKIVDHVKNWFDEHVDYQYRGMSCRPGKKCGHYTQVVSDKSTVVGCAVAMCPNGVKGFVSQRAYLVACNYGPAGNIYGKEPYETQEKSCPLDHPQRSGIFCGGKRTAKIDCVDSSPGCPKWQREGKCAMCHNPYYDSVTSQCPKTCGVCK